MNIMTRRNLLTTASLGAAGVALAACGAGQLATFESQLSSLYNDVQNAVKLAQSYIPSIDSIAETLAGLFGPAWQTAITFGISLTNQVVAAIESALNVLAPPAASAKLHRMGAAMGTLVTIGPVPGLTNPKTGGGVIIVGYK